MKTINVTGLKQANHEEKAAALAVMMMELIEAANEDDVVILMRGAAPTAAKTTNAAQLRFENFEKLANMYEQGQMTRHEILDKMNITESTFYRMLREYRKQEEEKIWTSQHLVKT